VLEVETTGHPIHIQQFPHQVQSWTAATLHRGHIHLAKVHSAGGDELLAEGSSSTDAVVISTQISDQRLLRPPAEVGPAQLRRDPMALQ